MAVRIAYFKEAFEGGHGGIPVVIGFGVEAWMAVEGELYAEPHYGELWRVVCLSNQPIRGRYFATFRPQLQALYNDDLHTSE